MDCKQITCSRGLPSPIGLSESKEGLNFSLYSQDAEKILLSLFLPGDQAPFKEVPLFRTGQVWHVLVGGLPDRVEYGYKVQKKGRLGPLLIDPYARSLNLSNQWGQPWKSVRSRALTSRPFDWQGSTYPRIPMEELIIYEMHLRGFTRHSSSGVAHPGTFSGMIEKIPYLKEMGVNAVELLPLNTFNETENLHSNPRTGEKLYNFWGYSPVTYFGLMNRYASKEGWGEEIDEFKELVRALHLAGIEVILDVVYNHTAEAEKKIISLRGIDEQTYYMFDETGELLNYSGCGNTLNSNHPIVCGLILDSLRYLVSEFHIDGFRFDLASTFCRDEFGKTIENPAIVCAITNDPILSNTKLIAEAWDAAGLYQVGTFPGGQRWAQWNGRYRDVVRRFIKGTDGETGAFATALSGSEDLFFRGTPSQSINFITAHDGFTLRDLVSYSRKHNLENAENNQDGLSDNVSWNCGHEGPSNDPKILSLRDRQMCNFLLALYVSVGTPMLLMGDEYGHTKGGNNNTYCQDNEKNYFLWDHLNEFSKFNQLLIGYRKKLPHFRRESFLTKEDVIWHGHTPENPDWSVQSRFIAYELKHPSGNLYIAFNAHFEPTKAQLPNGKWNRLIDTSLPSQSAAVIEGTIEMQPYSAVMLAVNLPT